jgi:hypothetical protein
VRNKPRKSANGKFSFITVSLNPWYPSLIEQNEDYKKVEALLTSLHKLELASEFYEDYGCSDNSEFKRTVTDKAKLWWLNIEIAKRTSKQRTIDRLRSLSRQSNQAPEPVDLKDKCLCPSSSRVDSS